jgi:hypothetical protein
VHPGEPNETREQRCEAQERLERAHRILEHTLTDTLYTHTHIHIHTHTRRSVGSHGGNAGGSLPDQGRPEAPHALPPRQHGVWPGEEKEVCVCTCEKERAKLPAPTCVRALVCMCVDIRNT